MNAKEFCDRLSHLAPSSEDLIKIGFKKNECHLMQRYYLCKGPINDKHFDDPLLDLIHNYDVKNVEIGYVVFKRNMKAIGTYQPIGNVDADILAYDTINKEIVVLDYSDSNNVLWKCARSGNEFLDALIIVAKFTTNSLFNDSLEDQGINNTTAQLCSETAGGNDYLNFYKMVLGSEQ